MIEMISVSSSNIQSVGYDTEALILQIRFRDGGVYQYSGVPPMIFHGLMSSASKGKYATAHIYKKFSSRKIA